MIDALRFWFVGVYIVLFLFFLAVIFRFRRQQPAVERKTGPLPSPAALITWLVPPIILLIQFG